MTQSIKIWCECNQRKKLYLTIMKNLKQLKKWGLLFLVVLAVLSCKKEETSVGEPPVADAGTDINAFVDSNVTLNGSNSAPA